MLDDAEGEGGHPEGLKFVWKVQKIQPGVCKFFSAHQTLVIVLSISEDKYKSLTCCTGFPTLGFSEDNCPKIIVFMWLFLLCYLCKSSFFSYALNNSEDLQMCLFQNLLKHL